MKVASIVGVLLSVSIIGVVGQQTITTAPNNVAQYVGDNVKLVCEFQESNYELVWSECITIASPVCNALFRDGAVIGGATPPPRYSVVNSPRSSGKKYDLVITGLQTADGGQFRCDGSTGNAPAYAEVIVLGSDKKCSNNLTSGSEVELGDFIYLSSDVTFYGRWAPVARFKYPNRTVLPGRVHETSGNTAKYGVVLEAVKSLQGQTLSAEWYFDDVTGTATGKATNTPTFPGSNTGSSQPITVFYPPEGLTIDPLQESYQVGETITCTAQGNPSPGIQWINMNDSTVSVDCPTGGSCQLVVSQDWLGTTATYRCQPCNNYFSQKRCISQDITFTAHNMACEREQDIPDGFFLLSTGGLAGIIVVCVLLLTGNVILAIPYWRTHGKGKNKDPDSASVERDVTSPSYQNIATYANVSGGARGARGVTPVTHPGSDPHVNVSVGARGAGGVTPVTQPGSDPHVNVSGGARGAGGLTPVTHPGSDPHVNVSEGARGSGAATPVTQPGSEPYAELGPIRDPPRRAEYDVLRLPAASDLNHDVTHNYING